MYNTHIANNGLSPFGGAPSPMGQAMMLGGLMQLLQGMDQDGCDMSPDADDDDEECGCPQQQGGGMQMAELGLLLGLMMSQGGGGRMPFGMGGSPFGMPGAMPGSFAPHGSNWGNSGGGVHPWRNSGNRQACPVPQGGPVGPGGANGQRLAQIAEGMTQVHCDQGYVADGHHCSHWGRRALEQWGYRGGHTESAADMAPRLANDPHFQEVSVGSPDQLRRLPAGAVVVWGRGNGHSDGHIGIALGDGREASDVIRPQTTHYGTQYRVFMPREDGQATNA